VTGKAAFYKIGISALDPCCPYRYFPEDTSYVDLLGEMVSIKYRNLIKIVGAFSRKSQLCGLESIRWAPVLGVGMFIFTGHRPMKHTLLNTEYE
jgi:hypothetical protein